jgi:ABC-type transport system substrate-binding protein
MGINHPKLPGYNAQVRSYPYDPAQAKALITRVGWDSGSLLRIYVPTGYRGAVWERSSEKILDNLASVGIKAQFVAMSWDALLRLMTTGGGASYLAMWASGRSDFGYPYFSMGIAQARHYKEDVEQLISQFDKTTDSAAQLRIAQDLEQRLLDRALIVPLFFTN